MKHRLGADWSGALLVGGMTLVMYIAARLGGAPFPEHLGWGLLPVLVATALGYAIGRSQQTADPWSARELALTVGLGGLGGLLALGWERFRPSDLGSLSLLALVDGIFVLPAIMPAAVVPRPGAALLSLMVAQLRVVLPGALTSYPALDLLQVPLIVAPAELWLLNRRADRSPRTLLVAGALIGLGAFVSARIFQPGAYHSADWLGVLVGSLLAGLAAGWLTARVRDRLARRLGSPFGTPAEPRA